MDDSFAQYIDVITQAPVAIITLYFIYNLYKLQSKLTERIADISEKLIELINKLNLK